jgi:hypothetical protein
LGITFFTFLLPGFIIKLSMAERLKQKLNINKVGLKNLFLLILAMVVMVAVNAITKATGKGSIIKIDKAQAQCWTSSGGGNCGDCACQDCDTGGGSGASGACDCGDCGTDY